MIRNKSGKPKHRNLTEKLDFTSTDITVQVKATALFGLQPKKSRMLVNKFAFAVSGEREKWSSPPISSQRAEICAKNIWRPVTVKRVLTHFHFLQRSESLDPLHQTMTGGKRNGLTVACWLTTALSFNKCWHLFVKCETQCLSTVGHPVQSGFVWFIANICELMFFISSAMSTLMAGNTHFACKRCRRWVSG